MSKQVVIKDLLISYNETQGDGGKTLLFLHGWRSNKEVWQPIIQELIQTLSVRPLLPFGHPPHAWGGGIGNIYALDLPGFGGSQTPNPHPGPLPKGEGGWGVGDYADVVAEFIRKLDLHNVIVVGHSFGGRIAIKLCGDEKYQRAINNGGSTSSASGTFSSPGEGGKISKLVLVDSAGFAMPSSRKNFYRLIAKIAKPIFKPRMMQGLRKKIYQQIGAEDYLATPELQKTFVNVAGEDLSADMKNIKCPTLIVNGENDNDTPLEFGRRMNSLIPNSKFLILNNAGHFSFLDRPGKFVEVLQQFIKE